VNVPAGGAGYNSERVTRNCQGTERAISAGTAWGDDGADLELFIGRLVPVTDAQNRVTGFLASGLNDSGQTSTFRVHSLCYTP
jgi:hypothetical protein